MLINQIKTYHISTIMLGLAGLASLTAAPAAAQVSEDALVHQNGSEALEWGPCPAFMPEGCQIAVLNGDPAEPRADIFFRLPGGAKAERHWHSSAERMVLTSGEMVVTYDGQEPAAVPTGAYAYGPAELPHSAECISDEDCILYIGFNEPIDAYPGEPEE